MARNLEVTRQLDGVVHDVGGNVRATKVLTEQIDDNLKAAKALTEDIDGNTKGIEGLPHSVDKGKRKKIIYLYTRHRTFVTSRHSLLTVRDDTPHRELDTRETSIMVLS